MSQDALIDLVAGPWKPGSEWKNQHSALLEAISRFGVNAIRWSWYEPDPVALLESGLERECLQPLLRAGVPELPEGARFEVLMLFGDRQGIVLRQLSTGLRGLHWSEAAVEKDSTLRVQKFRESLLLRSDKDFLGQFGLSPRLGGGGQELDIVSYRNGRDILAWTLIDRSLDPQREASP